MRTLTLSIAVLFLAPFVVAEDLGSVLDRAPYSTSEREAIERSVRAAEERGIDRDLLVPRVAEGVAKRASAELLRDAIDSEVASLDAARLLILEAEAPVLIDDRPSWQRAANLLDAGFSAETVTLLARAAADRADAFRPGTLLLTLLAEWGLDEEDAATLAGATIDSRLPTQEFPAIIDLLIAGRARRVPPAEMARRLIETLPRTRNLRELRRATL